MTDSTLIYHLCIDDDNRNMMALPQVCNPQSSTVPYFSNPRMSDWQVLLVRASKHVTYF